jgi:hypothetical protein
MTFDQKLSQCWDNLIARSCRMGAPEVRFQRIPLRQKRALISSLHPRFCDPTAKRQARGAKIGILP